METFLGHSEVLGYEFGPFRLELKDHLLYCNRDVVHLTPKVFDILLVLIQNHGHVVEKEKLMNAVWPEAFVEEGNLTRNISTLRKALGESHGNHSYIETIPCRGYRFVSAVRIVTANVDEITTVDKSAVPHLNSLGAKLAPTSQLLSLLKTAALIQEITGEIRESDSDQFVQAESVKETNHSPVAPNNNLSLPQNIVAYVPSWKVYKTIPILILLIIALLSFGTILTFWFRISLR